MPTVTARPQEIERAIRNVPDFPKPGIQFKDITPVLADARLFAGAIDLLTEKFKPGTWTRWWALTRADLFSPPPPP
jgi:adenine/guanine phosphoribosyltransferase-like PRPP-binding protein